VEALEAEIKKHLNTWRSYARGLMKNELKGDDLLSEALLKILENQRDKAEELALQGKLLYYVNKCLYLMAVDPSSRFHLKYDRFNAHWKDDDDSYLEYVEQPWLGSRIDNEYIDAYIAIMPEREAIMLRLYMMEGFSYSDLSHDTGIPIKILYKITEKAINKIRKNAKIRSAC